MRNGSASNTPLLQGVVNPGCGGSIKSARGTESQSEDMATLSKGGCGTRSEEIGEGCMRSKATDSAAGEKTEASGRSLENNISGKVQISRAILYQVVVR